MFINGRSYPPAYSLARVKRGMLTVVSRDSYGWEVYIYDLVVTKSRYQNFQNTFHRFPCYNAAVGHIHREKAGTRGFNLQTKQ